VNQLPSSFEEAMDGAVSSYEGEPAINVWRPLLWIGVFASVLIFRFLAGLLVFRFLFSAG
jgi:hypothetical protein